MQIISEQFPENQYVKEITRKSQIIIHHTVSGPSINGDVNWWKSTPDRVATHFIIDREGVIHQLFSTDYWAYALGIKSEVFKKSPIYSPIILHLIYIRKISPFKVEYELYIIYSYYN